MRISGHTMNRTFSSEGCQIQFSFAYISSLNIYLLYCRKLWIEEEKEYTASLQDLGQVCFECSNIISYY